MHEYTHVSVSIIVDSLPNMSLSLVIYKTIWSKTIRIAYTGTLKMI